MHCCRCRCRMPLSSPSAKLLLITPGVSCFASICDRELVVSACIRCPHCTRLFRRCISISIAYIAFLDYNFARPIDKYAGQSSQQVRPTWSASASSPSLFDWVELKLCAACARFYCRRDRTVTAPRCHRCAPKLWRKRSLMRCERLPSGQLCMRPLLCCPASASATAAACRPMVVMMRFVVDCGR